MKIAIISDIHGNMAYLEKTKEIVDREKIEVVICCGDIQTNEVFLELDSWTQKVYLALGNADFNIRQELNKGLLWAEKMEVFLDYGVANISGAKIAFCHFDYLARKLAEEDKFDIIFYGHTHTPWQEMIGKTLLLNPGEITAQYGKASFAIFDLKNMEADLKILS